MDMTLEDKEIALRQELKKDLRDYMDDLISQYRTYDKFSKTPDISISDLTDDEKQKFVAYLLKLNHSSYFDYIEKDSENLFANYLFTSSLDDQQTFVDELKRKAIESHEDEMQNMLTDRIMNLFSADMYLNGFYRATDNQTGELSWSRR